MANDYIPKRDLAAAKWLANFSSVVEGDGLALFITQAQVDALVNANVAFQQDLAYAEQAKLSYEGAIETKDASRALVEETARVLAQKFRGDLRIPAATLNSLGLTPRKTVRTAGVLNPARDLVATVDAQTSTASLKWNRNSSTVGTAFVVEAQVGNTGTWTAVGVTTKTRFEVQGIPAGVKRSFRVVATRKSQTAGPSNVASIYAPALSVAA